MKNIRPILAIFCVVLFMHSCAPRGQRSLNPKKATITLIEPDTTTIVPLSTTEFEALRRTYPKDAGVYLNHSQRVESLYELPYRSHYYDVTSRVQSTKYVVLSADHTGLQSFSLTTYGPEKLKRMYAIVVSPDGKKEQYSVKDCIKQYNSNSTDYSIQYVNAVPGSIVMEGYEIEYSIQRTFSLQFSLPAESVQFEHLYDDHLSIMIRNTPWLKSSDFQVSAYAATDNMRVSYSRKNVPGLRSESYAPQQRIDRPIYQYRSCERSRAQLYEKMSASPKTFIEPVLNDDLDELWMKEFSDNMLIGRTYRSLVNDKVKDFAKSITANTRNKREAIDSVHTWIHKHLSIDNSSDLQDRMDRIDGFQDLITMNSATNAYATAFEMAMLISLGFRCELALIEQKGTNQMDELGPEFFSSPDLGIICYDGTTSYLLFADDAAQTIDYVSPDYRGAKAFVIGGFDKDATEKRENHRLMSVWTSNMTTQQTTLDNDMVLHSDGSADVSSTLTLGGSDAHLYRKTMQQLDSLETVDYLLGSMVSIDRASTLKSYEIKNLNSNTEPLIIKLNYVVGSMVATVANQRVLFSPGVYSASYSYHSSLENAERTNPIEISSDTFWKLNLSMHYPKEWTLSALPKDVNVKSELGTSSVMYDASSAGELSIVSVLKKNRGTYPKEKLRDLLDLIGTRSAANVESLVFSTK